MDPNGEFFNPKVLFDNSECTRLHMNENENVVSDTGNVQSALASILPQQMQFYVNGIKKEDDLYSYEDTNFSNNTLYHKASTSGGGCLTFSSVGGSLQSVGVDCDTQLMPLCFRETSASDLSFLNEQCNECSNVLAEPSCHKWVDLEDYPTSTFKITGAQICTQPCGPRVAFKNQYCKVKYEKIFI